jgi:hypothetical protein
MATRGLMIWTETSGTTRKNLENNCQSFGKGKIAAAVATGSSATRHGLARAPTTENLNHFVLLPLGQPQSLSGLSQQAN